MDTSNFSDLLLRYASQPSYLGFTHSQLWTAFIWVFSLAFPTAYTWWKKKHEVAPYELSFTQFDTVPLATIAAKVKGCEIAMEFTAAESKEARAVQAIYAHYVLLTNTGSHALRDSDLNAKDQFRLEISNGEVLSVQLEDATSPNSMHLRFGKMSVVKEQTIQIPIHFDLLNPRDSACIRILSETENLSARTAGVIANLAEGTKKFHFREAALGQSLTHLGLIFGAYVVFGFATPMLGISVIGERYLMVFFTLSFLIFMLSVLVIRSNLRKMRAKRFPLLPPWWVLKHFEPKD